MTNINQVVKYIKETMCNFERTKFFFSNKLFFRSRDDGIEVTLLPIPNRKVKVYSADGTAWETVWQSRTLRGNFKRDGIYYLFFRMNFSFV